MTTGPARPPVPENVRKAAVHSDCRSGYVFDWQFHIACNYRCRYCYYDGHWADLGKRNRVETLDAVLSAWERVYGEYGECAILFNGGEPTVYPGFEELMTGLTRRHLWSFNTNLSWDKDRWREFARRLDVSRGQVHFSYHPTEEPDLDAFIDRARLVRDLGLGGKDVCVVAYPPLLDRFRDACLRFRELGFDVRPQPFNGGFEGRRYPDAYTEAQQALIRGVGQEVSSVLNGEIDYALAELNPFGKPCHSGRYYAFINQEGDVFRCTQVPWSPEERLGNLYDGFRLRDESAPCPKTFCQCSESRWLAEKCGG